MLFPPFSANRMPFSHSRTVRDFLLFNSLRSTNWIDITQHFQRLRFGEKANLLIVSSTGAEPNFKIRPACGTRIYEQSRFVTNDDLSSPCKRKRGGAALQVELQRLLATKGESEPCKCTHMPSKDETDVPALNYQSQAYPYRLVSMGRAVPSGNQVPTLACAITFHCFWQSFRIKGERSSHAFSGV